MKFNKLDNNPNFPSMQEDMLKFWEEDKTFLKSLENKDKKEVVFSDSEKLENIGLNIPQITKLMIMLKNNGVGISSECFTVDEAVNAVKEYLKTGRNGK